MKSESGSDYEASCASSNKATSKSASAPRKPRAPRPKLMKWSDTDWRQAILAIVHACGEKGVQIPFDAAARTVNPNCTGGALQQAILKLRGKQMAEGHEVPILKMAWSKGDGTGSAPSEKAKSKVGNSLSEPAKVVYRNAPRKPTADAFTKAHIVKIKTNSTKNVKGRNVGSTPNTNLLVKREETGLSPNTLVQPFEHGPDTPSLYYPAESTATPTYTPAHANDPPDAKRSLSDVEDDSDDEVNEDAHKKAKTSHNDDFEFDPFCPNTFDRAFTRGGRGYNPFEFGTESFHEDLRIRDAVLDEHANDNDNDTDHPMANNDDQPAASNYDHHMINSYDQPVVYKYDPSVVYSYGQPMFDSFGYPMASSYLGDTYYPNGPPVPTVERPDMYTTVAGGWINRRTGNSSLERNNTNREDGHIASNRREMEVGSPNMPYRPRRNSHNDSNRYDLGCFNNGSNGIHDTSLPAVGLFSVIADPDATHEWVHVPGASRSLPYIPRPPFGEN